AMPRAFWFMLGDVAKNNPSAAKGLPADQRGGSPQSWLAIRSQEVRNASWFKCWKDDQLASGLSTTVARADAGLDFFGVELLIAGRAVVSPRALSSKRTKGHDEVEPE